MKLCRLVSGRANISICTSICVNLNPTSGSAAVPEIGLGVLTMFSGSQSGLILAFLLGLGLGDSDSRPVTTEQTPQWKTLTEKNPSGAILRSVVDTKSVKKMLFGFFFYLTNAKITKR